MKKIIAVFAFATTLSFFLAASAMAKTLKSDGKDCKTIGNWNESSKTCTLTSDVHEIIHMDSDITLDGNGHSVIGGGNGYGIYMINKSGVEVRNIIVKNFGVGIGVIQSECMVKDSVFTENGEGISMAHSVGSVVERNKIFSNKSYGIYVYYANDNTVSENIIEKNGQGVFQIYGGRGNLFEKNVISQNSGGGMFLWGRDTSDYRLVGNSIFSNQTHGIILQGKNFFLSENLIHGNGRNFYMNMADELETNQIDTTNKVEGKSIYYVNGATGEFFGETDEMGLFYCIRCQDIKLRNSIFQGAKSEIVLYKTFNSVIEGVRSLDKSLTIYLFDSPSNTISNSDFFKAYFYGKSSNNWVYSNNFWDIEKPFSQSTDSIGIYLNKNIPIGGNYWKKNESNCTDANQDGFCDKVFRIDLNTDTLPLVKEIIFDEPGCQEKCFSNVLFLPGHQSTRLYKKDSDGSVDQLWEPTNHNEDVEQLYLDSSGNSVEPDVYAGEVVDEIYGFGGNVYKSFMSSMDEFVQSGEINGWDTFPYDWRMPLEEIVDSGTRLENGADISVISRIQDLAQDSKSKKVTIVAHSNGGLLAKVIMDRLEKSGKADLVDRIIMVGVPQVGTPKAIASLLHGDGTELLHGFILDRKTGRSFAENMQSAYNLLPSKKYFEVVQDPVIEFKVDVDEIYDFRSIYEENIASFGEFKSFLLGDNGERLEPDEGDTDSPNVLKENLFSRSTDLHEDFLDSWRAPEGVEVIQIAGWGLDTIRGIEYDDCDIIFCPDDLSNLDRSPILTEDGDGTVVVPSAVVMEDVKKYYLDLKGYNNLLDVNIRVSKDHANILEVKFLQNFIKNIMKGSSEITEHITIEKPKVKNEDKRLRYSLHSPVSLHIFDEQGRHTGLIENPNSNSDLKLYEQQVPNSYYMEFGEAKYAGSEGNLSQKVVLEGEDLGTFTFEIDEIFGSGEVKNTSFENIPTVKGMKAEIAISNSVGEMELDMNGDSEIDFILGSGEEIKKETLLEIFKKVLELSDIHETIKQRLIEKVDNAKKQFEKNHENSAQVMLKNVIHQIKVFSDENTPEKFRISVGDAEKLIGIIEKIINS